MSEPLPEGDAPSGEEDLGHRRLPYPCIGRTEEGNCHGSMEWIDDDVLGGTAVELYRCTECGRQAVIPLTDVDG